MKSNWISRIDKHLSGVSDDLFLDDIRYPYLREFDLVTYIFNVETIRSVFQSLGDILSRNSIQTLGYDKKQLATWYGSEHMLDEGVAIH